MILRNIHLNNFGLYAGSCEIDLVPHKTRQNSKPIVLVGGKNGSGKTTLLEGVRLALYGRRALGTRVGQTEYEEYLRKRVHHASGANSASVGLEFDYSEAGVVHRYRVRREWTVRGKSVTESLLLEKDGALVTTVPREEWPQFLQELIPPGVSQLFFFDGEKIREIADADENNEQLAEAVRALLGIDLVERARTDLGLYLARTDRGGKSDFAARLDEVRRKLGECEERIAELGATTAELRTTRDSQERAAEHIRRRFVSEGGDAVQQKVRVEAERAEVQSRIAAYEQELKDLANGLLPFALAPKLTKRFTKQLEELSHQSTRQPAAEALSKGLEAWKKTSDPKRSAEWSAKHWSDLQKFLKAWSSESTESAVKPALFPEVADATQVLNKLSEMQNVVRPRAATVAADLERLNARLFELEAVLVRAESATTGDLMDELRRADEKVGATDATLSAAEQDLTASKNQRKLLERDLKNLLADQAQAVKQDVRFDLAARAAQVLVHFEKRLLERKLQQLRAEFVRHFNYLARKDDLVADVRIDADTFSVTLVDKNGRAIPKAQLSAGEQQIYAITMLWALAKTSGRMLPMIIDTPLGRLDSEHRDNLIHRYFPFASHQVILLSTDTEVNASLLEELGDHVSHTYRLNYQEGAGRTEVVPGYFTEPERKRERRNAIQ